MPEFHEMLEGRLSIDDYVMGLDSGFPEFQRRMCGLLQALHSGGKRVLQIEPYIERLLQIHERLADGETPREVVRNPGLQVVYEAEKEATGALLDYYKRSLTAPFEDVIEAVKAFARADAARLTLRERLRAQAIEPLAGGDADVYVEAGYIHYPLYIYLKRAVGPGPGVRVVYLLAPVVRRLGGRRRNMGPGDILTLHYALHGGLSRARADLLAGRSLIYIKLLKKDELLPGTSAAPHSEDQTRVNGLVDRLTLEDCGTLFDQIRRAGRESALRAVEALVAKRARAPEKKSG